MSRRLRGLFPALKRGEWRPTSPEDQSYNCICWAAEPDRKRWWWPDPMYQDYWPQGITREATLQAFEEAFRVIGFDACDDEELEEGREKVAIFLHGSEVTHAARQLPSGKWTSKLGELDDIEHELRAVEGDKYGRVAAILARPLAEPDTTAQ